MARKGQNRQAEVQNVAQIEIVAQNRSAPIEKGLVSRACGERELCNYKNRLAVKKWYLCHYKNNYVITKIGELWLKNRVFGLKSA